MPFPYEVLEALNATLINYKKKKAGSLGHTLYITEGDIQCFGFAGEIYEKLGGTGEKSSDGFGANMISLVKHKELINIAVMGDPSTYNHGFDIFVWYNEVLIIQVFVEKQVNLLKWMSVEDFLAAFEDLRSRNSGKIVNAYQVLFGVTIPSTFVINSIYVSLI